MLEAPLWFQQSLLVRHLRRSQPSLSLLAPLELIREQPPRDTDQMPLGRRVDAKVPADGMKELRVNCDTGWVCSPSADEKEPYSHASRSRAKLCMGTGSVPAA